jgi:hypothetical protein
MTYDPTWLRTSPVLIPQAVQNDSLNAQKGSVRLDALDWGQKSGETTLDSNQTGSVSLSLAPLNNGKMFVAWAAGTDGRYAIVDSNGSLDSTAYQVFDSGGFLDSTSGHAISTVLLPNGNVVLAYAQDQGASNAIVFKIYDENGAVVQDTVTVKVNATETNWGVGLAALPDGRFIVTWQEASVGNMSYFSIYDINGNLLKGYTSLGGNYGVPQAAPLSDGNWIVTYENTGIRYRTYNRQGIQVVGETLFKSGVSQAAGIRTLGNGQIVIPFARGFGVIDRQGNVVTAPVIFEGSGTYSITVLPHDNIVAQNNVGTAGYYKVYDTFGNLVKSQVTYATDADTIVYGDVATFKNGNFMLAYVTGSTTKSVKFYIHQGTKAGFGGDLQVEGAFSLATGTTVNNISTDNTLSADSDNVLVTQKAIKYYVDTSIGDQSHVKIWDGDSRVQVVDDGTSAARVDIVIDSTTLAQFVPTGFKFSAGATINEFSTDGTLAGDSDTVVPTEKAVKTYVDTEIAAISLDEIYAGDSYVKVIDDGTSTSSVEVVLDSTPLAQFVPTGFKFSTGATINEFSTDGTLAGDSDTVVPTEKAVKTYVDTEIAAISLDTIYAGDSYVKVTDDGTAVGYVEIVTDGVQVAYFDPSSSTQRIGKTTGSGRIDVSGSSVTSSISSTEVLNLSATTQTMGVSTDTYLRTSQSTDTIQAFAGATELLSLTPTTQTLGRGAADTGVVLNQSTDTAAIYAGTINLLSLTPTSQRLGVSGDTALTLNTSADTFTLSAGAVTQISGGLTSITLGISGDTTIEMDSDADSVTITAGGQSQIVVETTGTTIHDDLTVAGDLFVDGTSFVVHNQEVTTSDNIIVVNYGEVGPGVTAGTAGLQVDRGSLPDYFFVFAEDTDTFRVGELGDTQAVATREDSPVEGVMPYWNDVEKRFDTAGDTFIFIDQTAGSAIVAEDSIEAMTVDENGLQLFTTGATVNEFSTDGTLADNSDSAVPTEKAVKTYVDNAVSGISSNMISADDSYVKVVDDGTATGYVEIVTDGVQVAYFDSESSSVRIGKASGGSKVTFQDILTTFHVGGNDVAFFDSTSQQLGGEAASFVVSQADESISGTINGTEMLYIEETNAQLGDNTYVYLDEDDGSVSINANGDEVFYADPDYVSIKDTGDNVEILLGDQGASTISLQIASTKVADLYSTYQIFGKADNGHVRTSDTNVVISDSTTTIATFSSSGFVLASGATISEYSTDGTLADDSDTKVATQKATKTYVDTQIDILRNEVDLVNVRSVSSDTTGVNGDIILVDTTAGDVTIELIQADDSRVIVKKKTTDSNVVNLSVSSGTIDGQDLVVIPTPYQSFTLVSDGTNFYII